MPRETACPGASAPIAARAGRPVVLVNRYTDSGEASSVACDNVMAGRMAASAAAWPSYALTTVDQNVERMSAEAISVLIERIDDHASLPVRRLIQPSLCIRDTA